MTARMFLPWLLFVSVPLMILGLQLVVREWEIHRARRRLAELDSLTRWRADINAAIEWLYARFGADTLDGRQLRLDELPQAEATRDFVHACLELLAARWQITLPPIDVVLVAPNQRSQFAGWFAEVPATWSFEVTRDGAVQADERQRWRISLSPDLFTDRLALSVVLAHEFAHGVLLREDVEMTATEILTDVATALAGWGALMYALKTRLIRGYRNRALYFSLGGPGYLDAPAIRHVLDTQRVRLGLPEAGTNGGRPEFFRRALRG